MGIPWKRGCSRSYTVTGAPVRQSIPAVAMFVLQLRRAGAGVCRTGASPSIFGIHSPVAAIGKPEHGLYAISQGCKRIHGARMDTLHGPYVYSFTRAHTRPFEFVPFARRSGSPRLVVARAQDME